MRQLLSAIFACFFAALGGGLAQAHPHILATVTIDLLYAGDKVDAIRETWHYDPVYSAFLENQSRAGRPSPLSDDELKALAEKQSSALSEFGYYTKVKAGGETVSVGPAKDVRLISSASGELALQFTLPLTSMAEGKHLSIAILDPQFFAYFTTSKTDGVRLIGANPTCRYAVTTPEMLDLKHTSTVPAAFWAALDGSLLEAEKFANRIDVSCP